MRVQKLEEVLVVKYHLGKNRNNEVFTHTNEGYLDSTKKLAASVFQQDMELTHLVSTLRQEYDPHSKTYQYQMQSYSSLNEFFVVDLGTQIKGSNLNL